MQLVVLLFALFASLFTLQKATLAYTEPFFLVGSRMAFAGVLLLGYCAVRTPQAFKFGRAALIALVTLALSNIYLTNIFEIWAIQHMVSSKACLIYSLSPFLSAFVAFFVLNERLSKRKWLGMAIGFFGLLPILFSRTQEEIAAGQLLFFSWAELSIVGAVLCSVVGWIMLKKAVSTHDISPIMANGFSMLAGGILALAHSYLVGETWTPVPVTQWQPFLMNSLLMCVISNLICYNLYGFLLKRFTATFMSFAGLITPLFASLFGYFMLGEEITWHFLVSLALFSVGLSIFYQEEIQKGEGFRVTATST